jgi:soluble lytic murein transglycosylase-like protein
MPRARSQQQTEWQTAAADNNASGCLSFYALPPLAVLVIVTFITALALNTPTQTSALPIIQPTTISSSPSGLSPIFTREIQHWSVDILRWANASSLDPNLVATIMQIESCGDPRALSRAGAMGLFQVMPFHFHFGENGFDPETNALRGLNYLARSLQTANGDARLALAGYNGGIGVIPRGEWTWHAETARYVQYGAPIYSDARSGFTSSVMLDEWYQKYGAGLCRQAAQRLGLP